MNRFLLFAAVVAWLLPNASFGEGATRETFLKYRDSGYHYLIAKKNDKIVRSGEWETTTAWTDWPTGQLAVGTLNNTSSPPCPLNIAGYVNLPWPSSREVLLRRDVDIPAGVRNVTIGVAVDNAVQIFLNGHLVTDQFTDGFYENIGCAVEDQKVFTVEDVLAQGGEDRLMMHGRWENSKSYLDVSITGDLPYIVTASAGDNGTIAPRRRRRGLQRCHPGF